MEELRVLMETLQPTNGETLSSWFTLPIDEAEFEEKMGVETDSEAYRIIEKELPFADEIKEMTPVETLNDFYEMYEDLPYHIQIEYEAIMTEYYGLNELYEKRYDIIHFPDVTSMTELAIMKCKTDPAFQSLSEEAQRYFDYEAYADNLNANGYYLETEHGIYQLP